MPLLFLLTLVFVVACTCCCLRADDNEVTKSCVDASVETTVVALPTLVEKAMMARSDSGQVLSVTFETSLPDGTDATVLVHKGEMAFGTIKATAADDRFTFRLRAGDGMPKKSRLDGGEYMALITIWEDASPPKVQTLLKTALKGQEFPHGRTDSPDGYFAMGESRFELPGCSP